METNLMEKEQKKVPYLFLSGNNVDKREQVKMSIAVEEDRDIQKLIRRGFRYGVVYKAGILAVINFVTFCVTLYCSYDAAKQFLQNASPSLPIIGGFISSLLVFLWSLRSIRQDHKIFQEIHSKWQLISMAIKKQFPKHPLELWHLYPASIIDAQIVLYAQRMLTQTAKDCSPCSLIFAGGPYASTFLVDSIDIEWVYPSGVNLNLRKIRHHYQKYLRKYSTTAVLSNGLIERNAFEKGGDKRRREISDCVFGVLYASGYLLSFLQEYFKKVTDYNNNQKIYIDVSALPIDQQRTARSVVEFITSPDYFTFDQTKSEQNSAVPILKIKQLNVYADQPPKYSKPDKNTLRLPMKRVFLKPFPLDASYDTWPLENLRLFKANKMIVLGGAEQNLLQCHIINRHRWSDPQTHVGNATGCRIGFSENAFDFKDHTKRQNIIVGMEGYVYLTRDRTIAPDDLDPKHKFRNCAQMMFITLDGIDITFIYGYSAVATKIAAAQYFHYLHELEYNGDTAVQAYIPDSSKLLIAYAFKYEGDTWGKLINYWDHHNPFENLQLDVKDTLDKISNDTSGLDI